MPHFNIPCSVFDPIRFTTATNIKDFIVDTWFHHGLISRSLFVRLPGIGTTGTGRVLMSSGMYVEQPETRSRGSIQCCSSAGNRHGVEKKCRNGPPGICEQINPVSRTDPCHHLCTGEWLSIAE